MRGQLIKKRSKKAGLPPGTTVHIGEKKSAKIRMRRISYAPDKVEEDEIRDPKELANRTGKVNWVNVDGVHDVALLEKIGASFGLHPLVIEDIANTDQRPKVEDFGDYLYIVIRMFDHAENGISSEQMSLILGRDFVLSFQEAEGDVFDSVRQRIRSGKGKIRKEGPDYLAYALIDAIVDDYFSLLEKTGEEIELMEERLVTDPNPRVLQDIHHLKIQMILLRKSVWPLREVVASLEKDETKLIRPGTKTYLRDVYDHTIHVIDTVETFRDMVSGMLDIYLSSVSNRLNEIMKFLTIITTIFIPLSFIAGVYGMNFRHMPELALPEAYPAVLGLMALVGLTMVLYFRKKKWI
jgi:magnesium transporter